MNKWLPSRAFINLFIFYLFGFFLFGIFRLYNIVVNYDLIANESIWHILKSFYVGWRFDQIVILLTLVPLLLITPFVNLSRHLVLKIVKIYLVVIYSIIFLLLLTDLRFMQIYHTHLNFLALEYIDEGATFWNQVVSDAKFYLLIFAWIGFTLVFIYPVHWLTSMTKKFPKRANWPIHIFYFVLFLSLFALGIRGRWELAPMDWGIAYYSHNVTLNQIALNGIYTFGRNLTETNHDPRLSFLNEEERFEFVNTDGCLAEVKKTLAQSERKWHSDYDLTSYVEQPQKHNFNPNIIVVVMESWSGRYTGALENKLNLTPYFDRLAEDGLFFTNFYTNGIRTNFGLGATLCSFPPIPGRAILKRYDARHPFNCLAEILKTRGYNNYFFYGGDPAFDNMEGFFRQKKYDRFFGQDNYDKDFQFSKWGIPDHKLFELISDEINFLPRPFQISVMTLSNHEPFDLPDSSLARFNDSDDSSKVYNSLIYADYALGYFIEQMKKQPVFDSTIFVFVPDHCLLRRSKYLVDPVNFHAPLLIYAPSLITPQKIATFGSQVDIIPTLMELVGGNYQYDGWGRDLLTLSPDSGFAIVDKWNDIAYYDEKYIYVEHVGSPPSFYQHDADTLLLLSDESDPEFTRRQELLRRYVQLADQLSMPKK